jgi:hypothetical protein
MRHFVKLMGIHESMKILDLGGHPDIWSSVSIPLDITILNLPGRVVRTGDTHHSFSYVEGDACNVDQFGDDSFDVVFSNSVIEHVGGESKMKAFAGEVRRLGRAYWVQTPSPWFPIEAHNGMPFWWFYPDWLREVFFRRWSKKLPRWTEARRETTVLYSGQLEALLPGARIHVERFLGLSKSYSAYHPPPRSESGRGGDG